MTATDFNHLRKNNFYKIKHIQKGDFSFYYKEEDNEKEEIEIQN